MECIKTFVRTEHYHTDRSVHYYILHRKMIFKQHYVLRLQHEILKIRVPSRGRLSEIILHNSLKIRVYYRHKSPQPLYQKS